MNLLISALALAAPPTDGLSAAEVNAVVEAVAPKPAEEAWLAIGWRTSLADARREAAAKGKPILLWEMDGHPLGCT